MSKFGANIFLIATTLNYFCSSVVGTVDYFDFSSTGCKSDIWKKIQANILKEPLVLLKQTIPQQKALDLSFNLTP